MATKIKGKRILVIGGAGSIGSATVKQIIPFMPSALHIVDINENSLAELVRDLRGNPHPMTIGDFRTLPLDYGSKLFQRFLQDEVAYDNVLNFAAIKHVRSEKDIYSVLHMIDTNIVKQEKLLRWLGEYKSPLQYFSVSTDKAAYPVNLMGATKRLMERLIFSQDSPERNWCITTARFANVAFSDGSLLYSWLQRIAKYQPIAAPLSTKRYFISSEEAGQICLMAAFLENDRHIIIPNVNEKEHMREISDVARDFIIFNGYRPVEYHNEHEAKGCLREDVAKGAYPLLLTPLDTNGEKAYEEFAEEEEKIVNIGFRNLKAIKYESSPQLALREFLDRMDAILSQPSSKVTKDEIVALVTKCVPEFRHRETGKQLDNRF